MTESAGNNQTVYAGKNFSLTVEFPKNIRKILRNFTLIKRWAEKAISQKIGVLWYFYLLTISSAIAWT